MVLGQRVPAIMVVDDEPLLRGMVCEHLASLGYAVIEAATGDEVWTSFCNGARPDLLLTDVRMPGALDGFALIRLMAAADASLRTMAMSGYAGAEGTRAARYDRFLHKPFTIARLEQDVADMLRVSAA